MTEVEPTLTLVAEYKQAEMLPRMRKIALFNIKKQRERGMPKSLNAFEIGMNVCINGRHYEYLGSTVGTPKGGHDLTPADIWCLVSRMCEIELKRLAQSGNPPLTEKEKGLFLRRDEAL